MEKPMEPISEPAIQQLLQAFQDLRQEMKQDMKEQLGDLRQATKGLSNGIKQELWPRIEIKKIKERLWLPQPQTNMYQDNINASDKECKQLHEDKLPRVELKKTREELWPRIEIKKIELWPRMEIKKIKEELWLPQPQTSYTYQDNINALDKECKQQFEDKLEADELRTKHLNFGSLQEKPYDSISETDEISARTALDPTTLSMCVPTFKEKLEASKNQKLEPLELLAPSQKEANKLKNAINRPTEGIPVSKRVNVELQEDNYINPFYTHPDTWDDEILTNPRIHPTSNQVQLINTITQQQQNLDADEEQTFENLFHTHTHIFSDKLGLCSKYVYHIYVDNSRPFPQKSYYYHKPRKRNRHHSACSQRSSHLPNQILPHTAPTNHGLPPTLAVNSNRQKIRIQKTNFIVLTLQ